MVSTTLLLLLTAVAAGTDIWRRKIYNWLTYPGILVGLLLSAVEPGGIGIEESLRGFFACGGLMLVCYVLFGIGGGDVKLIALLGAFLGLYGGLEAMLWTFVLGGALGLVVLIWTLGALRLLWFAWRQVFSLIRFGVFEPWPESDRKILRYPLFLAPAAFAAVVIMKFHLADLL